MIRIKREFFQIKYKFKVNYFLELFVKYVILNPESEYLVQFNVNRIIKRLLYYN